MDTDILLKRKKALYDKQLIDILNKEKLEKKDFLMLSLVFNKCLGLRDENLIRIETKRLLNFAKKHPEYSTMILQITKNSDYKALTQSNEKTDGVLNDIQRFLSEVSQELNSDIINSDRITKLAERIKLKQVELQSKKNLFSKTDYSNLMNALSDNLNLCETTLELCREEETIWQI